MDADENFLNAVDITSNIHAPGEYKYYYCGENNSETDKSFLVVASQWYTDKITPDMEILASCYNNINTAQIYFNSKTNSYNILIYQNVIDYRNENMILKLLYKINMPTNPQLDLNNNQSQIDKKKLRIFLVGKNYLIINIIDFNILLINFTNGDYITIFCRTFEEKETLFNIIETYDEPYMLDGEQKVRTYVFLSKKNQERKTPTYFYKYFIVQKDVFKLKNILLHSIDFDWGNAEPLGLKIGKIYMPDSGGLKFSFIFIFISSSTVFQLVTDYDSVNLHNTLKKCSRAENNIKENEEGEGKENNSEFWKEKKNKNEDKLNINNEYNKTKYWTIKRKIESEKKNFIQCIKILLNINDKRMCSFVLFFETKNIVSYEFNYTDTPEEIKEKIFIKSNINLSSEQRNFELLFKSPAKLYKFIDLYLFKLNSFFNYSKNNLIICEKNKMHIYSENGQYPIYTYDFFEEELSIFITFEGIGSTFLLTGNKLFKIIYNQRYELFSNEKIFNNEKITINYYQSNKKLSFPVFEFNPENIWNAYCISLGLEQIEFKEKEEEEEDNIETVIKKNESKNIKYRRLNSKSYNIGDKFCALCGKKSEKCCSDCNMRFYCCDEHFIYDFYSFHFFECQLIQFFSRKDIMTISDKEIRYRVLYNEIIKVCGRILTFIFMRIYCKKDYQYFLQMIITMIKLLENFGFKHNLADFCNCNYTLNERIINRYQKIIFYQEALFFYVQLNFLKCTFALKSNLYNLTDCYLKIINNYIIPLLTPKIGKKLLMSLKCDKPSIDILYNNQYFNQFNSELFFDIEKYIKNNNAPTGVIDLVEDYITKHLMSLSLLVKFKKKINSSIEVQDTFVDINLMFYDHFNESEKKVASYCYFFTSFYLVEIGKVSQTVMLYKRLIQLFVKLDNDINKLKALTYYNLGLLQYAIGNFDIGIHNIEVAYKLIVENNLSDKMKLKVIDSLGLAYLNRRSLYKSFLLIKKSIQERKKLSKKEDEIAITKLNVYLNYINDLYEYTFISKARLLIKKKYNNTDKMKLMKFVLGEEDKEMVISEQNINQFIKVAKFIWNLSDDVLKQLNADNPPKMLNNNAKDDQPHDKNVSFNSDISMNNTSTFMMKENFIEKEEYEEDYEDDIEIKTSLYDTLLSRKQQQDFKELKAIYLKRDIILRDSLGDIEKFNINYEPIFSLEFEKIIEKLKSSFLLKEIFYSFQNEKWRDELYNYNQNNILYGLSKYLKMEKIKNMLAIEKTKILEAIKQKKLLLKQKKNQENIEFNTNNLLIDNKNKVIINDSDRYDEEYENQEIEISNDISSKSSSSESNEKEKNEVEVNINYRQFKSKFISALNELEKDKKNKDLYEFLNFDEDYLYNLYINVFKNNPDYKFIFQNPLLILNYIFIEINKTPEIKIQKSDLEQNINTISNKDVEEEIKSHKDDNGIKEEKKESEEEEEQQMKFNSSSYSSNQSKSKEYVDDEKSNEDSSSVNSDENEKQEEQEEHDDYDKNNENENENDNNEQNKTLEEETKYEINRVNTLMQKFKKDENIYDYIRDEINETHEITLEYIIKKEEEEEQPEEKVIEPEIKRVETKNARKSEIKKGFRFSMAQDKKIADPKTLIEAADKYFLYSKEMSKLKDNDKTFADIMKHNRKRTQTEIQKINLDDDESKKLKEKQKERKSMINNLISIHSRTIMRSKKEEEKNNNINNNDSFNILKNKYVNYRPFINKDKKKSLVKNREKYDEKNDNKYFDLKKEMGLNNDNKIGKKRKESNLSVKNEKNLSSFEKGLNIKFINKNKSELQQKSKSKSKSKQKNVTYRFKSKNEREKEIEEGALLYLKNEEKYKLKNWINTNRSVITGSKNRNNNNIFIKKKVFKSTDEKKINQNKSDIEPDNYIKLYQLQKSKNKNKRKNKAQKIKINSSTTLYSTSSENNNNANKVKDSIINKNNNKDIIISNKNKNIKKEKSDIFTKEYKKIIAYNKRKKNYSQEKNYDSKELGINIDNNYDNVVKSMQADLQNIDTKYFNYIGTSPAIAKNAINYYNPKTGDRINPISNYYKKNNFIPTTNYTNSESPYGNNRLVTFQGKKNENFSDRRWPKRKYNI